MNTIIVTETAKNLRALGRAAMAPYRNLSMKGALVYGVALMVPPVLISILFLGLHLAKTSLWQDLEKVQKKEVEHALLLYFKKGEC